MKKGREKISLKEYCERVGRPLQSVSRDIKEKKELKGVLKVEQMSQRCFVTVDSLIVPPLNKE